MGLTIRFVPIFLLIFVVAAAPLAFAQLEGKWSTFVSPKGNFTLKYPSSFPTELILVSVDDYKNSPEITTMYGDIGYTLLVYPKNDTHDIKPYVEKRLENELKFDNITVFEPIQKVTYANTTGYEFTTNENTEDMVTSLLRDWRE